MIVLGAVLTLGLIPIRAVAAAHAAGYVDCASQVWGHGISATDSSRVPLDSDSNDRPCEESPSGAAPA